MEKLTEDDKKRLPARRARRSRNGILNLRLAVPQDIALLRHWDAQPHVIEGKSDEDWEWEKELARSPAWREQLIAELDGRPIGFMEIIDPALEDSHYWGDCLSGLRAIDIWIGEKDALGHGYGTEMMGIALGKCFADPSVQGVLVDPFANNNRARRFYEKLGFRFVEKRLLDGSDCAVYRIDRERYAITLSSKENSH